MRQKLFVLAILLLYLPLVLNAQSIKKAILKGRIISSYTKAPFNNITITIPDLKAVAVTDGNGRFSLSKVPYGSQTMIITGPDAQSDTINVNIDKNVIDLKDISVAPANASNEIPLIFIDDNTDADDDDGDAGMFVANQDPFLNNVWTFTLAYWYKPRGFRNRETQVNGIPLIDYERGFDTWGTLGGLNDVLRSRHGTYGLQPSEYSFGSVTGVNYIDAAAIDQRKGTSVSYTMGNRTFRNRLMVTHNSGLTKKGWAYSISGSRRWAEEGYFIGTFYDAYSFYGGVSKRTNKGNFNLTGFVAPSKRGRYSIKTEEVFNLADNQFNLLWGYQNGKKRNAVVNDIFQPMFIANYIHQPSDRLRWNTAIAYSFGKYKRSALDGYNSVNPYGDFYRNLPSYYLTSRPPFPTIANMVEEQLSANPELLQVQWDQLYYQNYANTETIHDVNGIAGNDFTGKRSLYVLSDYVNDLKKFTFNTNLEYYQNEHITLYGGLTFISQTNRNYRQLTDLLGGDYFVNYNQFAAQHVSINQSIIQNNLDKPNSIIRVGDKYNYDYKTSITNSDLWGQAAFTYNKFDLFAAVDLGYTSFSREGFMRNGLFPNNSYGKSPAHSFFTYKVKGGITYKIDMRKYLYLNAEIRQEAPLIANTYISVRTRDYIVNDPKTYNVKTLEGGYVMRSPSFTAKIAGYVSEINNSTFILRFFNDDPDILSLVNMVLQGVNERSIGTELTGIYKLTSELSVTGVAALGQRFYTNNPTAVIYQDNDPTLTSKEHTVYIKNYYSNQGGSQRQGAQSIYSIGVRYNSRHYWYANINFNYMDNSYVNINPERRITLAADTIKKGTPEWNRIYAQEKLPAVFTIDVNGGKSFNLSRYFKNLSDRTLLVFNIGVANLLNKTDIKVTGFEQLRYDYNGRNPDRFPNKYDYGFGINYYASISLRF